MCVTTSLTARLRQALAFATLTMSLLIAQGLGQEAAAQSLDIKLDSALSSGVLLGPSGSDVIIGRSPMLVDFDAAFIFDGDENVEWVLGSMMQIENRPALAINPQVRLRRTKGPFETFVGVGIPWYIAPLTRFGTELSFGVALPLTSPLALVFNFNVSSFFMGSDLPDDSTVFFFNGAAGIRMRF
jgi:hypothetical protein